MLILKVHPIVELGAILLVFYAAILGVQRTRSLHFGEITRFKRDLHAVVGAIAVITILCGAVTAKIIVSLLTDGGSTITTGMHGKMAMFSIPFLMFSIFSGFYLYLNPAKRRILPMLHAVNNLLVLLFCLYQIYSGIGVINSLPAG